MLTGGLPDVSAPLKDNPADESNACGVAPSVSDGQLVEQTMAGDRKAFDELIKRHQAKAVARSYRLLGNMHDAAEVTQDAFMKAYTSLRTLESPEKFAGWLMRIVSNLSLNKRRDRRKSAALPTDDLLGGMDAGSSHARSGRADDPFQQVAGKEMGVRLFKALDQLSEKQRQAIVMFTIEEMPQKEVAQAMDCSVEAVKWHVFQGRKRLREILKDLLIEQ